MFKSFMSATAMIFFEICNANAFEIKGIELDSSFNDLPGFCEAYPGHTDDTTQPKPYPNNVANVQVCTFAEWGPKGVIYVYNSGKSLNLVARIVFKFPYSGVLIGGAVDKALTEKYGPVSETGMGMMLWKDVHSHMMVSCIGHGAVPFNGMDTCTMDANDDEVYSRDQKFLSDKAQEEVDSTTEIPNFGAPTHVKPASAPTVEGDICSQPGYHCSPKSSNEPAPEPTTASGPTCSSPDTLEVLNKIVDDNAMNIVRAAAQRGKVDDKFINIITTDKTERKAKCKFDIELTISGPNAQGVNIVPVTKTWSETTGKQLLIQLK
jgi:hypothetical protein